MHTSSTEHEPRAASGFDNVVTIAPGDCDWISALFVGAADRRDYVRVAIDGGGVKFAIGRGTWTPAIGQQQP